MATWQRLTILACGKVIEFIVAYTSNIKDLRREEDKYWKKAFIDTDALFANMYNKWGIS